MDKSVWSEFKEKPVFKSLQEDIYCEILVIGGGMAGILTAHFLSQQRKDVVLVEAKSIGDGITKNTTAVITAQHDTPYYEMIKLHGKKKAKGYLNANLEAVENYKHLTKSIDCDFEIKPSYMYSRNKILKKEHSALKKLGYEAELTSDTGLPFKVKSAIKFNNMAQFHPLKFLYSIAKDLNIYENTFIENIKDHTAYTKKYKIHFKQAVVATHYPFLRWAGLFYAKLYQERSYIMALENAKNIQGTFIEDKTSGFYFRNYKNLLLVGKGDHRTGTKTKGIQQLKEFAKEYFPDSIVKFFWANQDCITLDSVPYIGEYGHLKDVFTITGFNFWGMTSSMVSAQLITDLICGKKNKYEEVFKTKRNALRLQLFSNLGVALLNLIHPTIKRCPHLGCALKYNKAEHSWDCQCHGSRFEKDGALIDNPATHDADV